MPSFRQKISYEIYPVGLDMVGIGRYDLLEPSRAEPKILASSSPPFAVFVRLIIL